MNSNVESGILAFLADQLDAEEATHGTGAAAITILAATIGGKQVQLFAATSNASIAEPLAKVCVKSSDAKIDAADTVLELWMTTMEIMIATPRNHSNFTEADHRAITAAVCAEMTLDNLATIATALAGFGISACNRWYYAGAPDQHTDGHWITLLRYDPFGFTVTL